MSDIWDGELELPTVADTERLGERLGAELRAGDLVLLAGPLGAGKTALVRGWPAAWGCAARSPRRRSCWPASIRRPGDGPAAGARRRLPARPGEDRSDADVAAELDDLDLDTDLDRAVVAVEWGTGVAERLAERAVQVTLQRRADDVRIATVRRRVTA